jgi:hypothetical protein
MLPSFDIFRVFNDEEPIWVEAAQTLDDALGRVRQIGELLPGEYFVHSQKTGVEICLTIRRSLNILPKFTSRGEPLIVRHRPKLPRKTGKSASPLGENRNY